MSTQAMTEKPRIMPISARPAEILLVEDSPGDARLMQEALREGKVANRVSTVKDGVEHRPEVAAGAQAASRAPLKNRRVASMMKSASSETCTTTSW